MLDEITQQIYLHLLSHGYTWKIDGERVVPSLELVREKVSVCLDHIEDNQTIEFGRILIKRSSGHTDIYMHIGEVNV
jgi:hypothetical protein